MIAPSSLLVGRRSHGGSSHGVRPARGRSAAVAAALIVSLSLAAPALAQDAFRAVATDRATHALKLGGTGSLDLRNVSGDIDIKVGGDSDVHVDVLRTSRGRTDADAHLGLDRVRVDVQQQGNRATISTEYPQSSGRQPFNVNVAYTVTAPAGTSVRIRSVSGDVSLTGITGEVSVDVVSGGITIVHGRRITTAHSISGDVHLTDVVDDAPLNVSTVSGSVVLERVSAPRLQVDVISGNITARGSADAAEMKSLSGNVEYQGPISRNGRYALTSHSGNVQFLPPAGSGFDLQISTFSGSIHAGSGVTLERVSASPRSLHTTVGGGGATVVLTSFSGNVDVSPR
jgi:DUF4097 and DUF4098 domain-containing protein YvlB